MRLLLILVLALSLAGQTTTTFSGKSNSKTVTFIPRPLTIISTVSCDILDPEPGESANCKLILNQPTRPGSTGYPITLIYQTGYSGPLIATVPAGSDNVTIPITKLVGTSSAMAVGPVTIQPPEGPASTYVAVMGVE